MEEKSRHEIITRAKITWAERKTNMSQKNWIDNELKEIGLLPLTDAELGHYALAATPPLFS